MVGKRTGSCQPANPRNRTTRVDAAIVLDYLIHLAVRQHVSASTQNQTLCALLCRDVIGVEPDGLASTVRARRGIHLPVVLSVTEVAALLDAMQGIPQLMATLIYGVGLRVPECCELRVKDIDVDQGLIHGRGGRVAVGTEGGPAVFA